MKRKTIRLWTWVDADPTLVRKHLTAGRPGSFERPTTMRERLVRRAVGNEVKRLRTETGTSQLHLAGRLGISQPQVSNIENGRAAIDLPILWDLADVFYVKPTHFVTICEHVVRQYRRTNTSSSAR